MKNKYKFIGMLVSFLFVAGLLFTGFILYNFPNYISKISTVTNGKQFNFIENKITLLDLVFGFTGFLGLIDIAIWMLALQHQSDMASIQAQKQIINVEMKNQSSLKESVADIADNDVIEHRLLSLKTLAGDTEKKREQVISIICNEMEASQAAYYRVKEKDNKKILEFDKGYAYHLPDTQPITFEFGEGLIGQVAKECKLTIIDNVPEGYVNVLSGLGKALPASLMISPVYFAGDLCGILEIASFHHFSKTDERFVNVAVNHIENL